MKASPNRQKCEALVNQLQRRLAQIVLFDEAIDRPLKNASEGGGAAHGCEDFSNGGTVCNAVWEKRSTDSGNDECDQGSF
jgi:hypothetical protein